MLAIVLTLATMFVVAGVFIWIVCQWVAGHLRGKPEATGQLVEHVLMPLLGKTKHPDGTGNV